MSSEMEQEVIQNIVASDFRWEHEGYFIKGAPVNIAVKDECREVRTCCKACIANCGVIATVKNGVVVKLKGDPSDPMSKGKICIKCLAGIQALYHPCRLKYPMIRVGKRGGGRWRRMHWEDALEFTAKKLIESKGKYGAESVICSSGGGGNPEMWSASRFCNIFGSPNWFEPGGAQCYLPRVIAYRLMYGGQDSSIADLKSLELYFPENMKTKSLVLWGAAPSYSSPACGGRMLVDLAKQGVKTVVIDPRLTPEAKRADVWLPVRPGTDVALLMAWIRYIITNDLYDSSFVLHWTNLPYLVDIETGYLLRAKQKDVRDERDSYLVWDRSSDKAVPCRYPWDDSLNIALDMTCEINGHVCKTGFTLLKERVKDYTLEKAADICWLEKEKIEEAIRIYTDNRPGGLVLGVATDQSPNSAQAAMCAAILNFLLGNVEKPGACIQRFPGSGVFDRPGNPVPPAQDKLPDEQFKKRLGGTEYKGLHFWLTSHCGSILKAMETGEPYPIKIWIERSANKLSALADASRWEKAMKRLDFIVHIYTFPTSFSACADILFPATEWLETNMIVECCNQLKVRQQTVHLWDTLDETVLWAKLAKKCADLGDEDCKRAFDKEYMGNDLAYWNNEKELFDYFLARRGLTFDQLAKTGPFEFEELSKWRKYYQYLEKDESTGLPKGFNTPSGKIELYAEGYLILGKTGKPFSKCELVEAPTPYDPLPYYLEPEEQKNDSGCLQKEYPLILTSGRVPFYHHATLRNIPLLREKMPVAEVLINPLDAEKYAISDGQWVCVESTRGKTCGKAKVSMEIRPGVVFMERFWNPETLYSETHGYKEMNVNMLTKADGPFNDVMGTYTLRGFSVKISGMEKPPAGVWTETKAFDSWKPLSIGPTAP